MLNGTGRWGTIWDQFWRKRCVSGKQHKLLQALSFRLTENAATRKTTRRRDPVFQALGAWYLTSCTPSLALKQRHVNPPEHIMMPRRRTSIDPVWDWASPAAFAHLTGSSVESLTRWRKDGEDANVPKDEMDRMVRFMRRLRRGLDCFSLDEPFSSLSLDSKVGRRSRLESPTACACTTEHRLLTHTKS